MEKYKYNVQILQNMRINITRTKEFRNIILPKLQQLAAEQRTTLEETCANLFYQAYGIPNPGWEQESQEGKEYFSIVINRELDIAFATYLHNNYKSLKKGYAAAIKRGLQAVC